MTFKAIIFDLDGTLTDTLADLTDAYNYGLKELGLGSHSKEEYRLMIGTGSRDLCRKALPANRGDLIDKLLELSLDYYADHYLDKTVAYDGIVGLVRELTRRGIRLAVLSNKPDNFTKLIVKGIFGANCFETVVGQRDGIACKPDPGGVLYIIEQMKLVVGNIMYVGDSATDMDTAKAAGVMAVGVSWGFRDSQELLEAGAKRVIDQPSELLELL